VQFVKITYFLLFVSFYQVRASDTLRLVLPYQVAQVSINRYQQLFIVDNQANVYQYDTTFELIQTFSPTRKAKPTILEAWETMRIFLFFQELQEYVFLNRLLSQTENKRFSTDNIQFVRVATVAADGNIWLFDEIDFSLKKYNPTQKNILITNPLDLSLLYADTDISFLKEYQNKLFMVDKSKGILVFDNLGNYIETIQAKDAAWITFCNDEIIFPRHKKWQAYHLYTRQERFICQTEANFVILTDRYLIEIFDKELVITNK